VHAANKDQLLRIAKFCYEHFCSMAAWEELLSEFVPGLGEGEFKEQND
jgi:hypothetical protein